MRPFRIAALFSACITPATLGAGFAHNDNFIIFTPAEPTQEAGQQFAKLVLRRAETFRAQVAKEWLGTELPRGAGRTTIYIDFSDAENSGLTWAKDDPERTLHAMYLTTSRENAAGSTLHHEIVHAVLATRFPHPQRLPAWLEEGIASRYDDKASIVARDRIVRSWTRSDRVPPLIDLLTRARIGTYDDSAYAAATSLVSFLLSRADRQTLLAFGETGQKIGWNAALQTHYGIDGIAQLQPQWEAWLKTTHQTASGSRPRSDSGA